MPQVYSIDVRIYGTLYVKAESKEAALELAKQTKNSCLELPPGEWCDLLISDERLDSPSLPEVSLSPMMTCHGPDDGDQMEVAVEPDDDEDEEETTTEASVDAFRVHQMQLGEDAVEDTEELDELVHEAKSNEAAAINNQGKDAQREYLQQCGVIAK